MADPLDRLLRTVECNPHKLTRLDFCKDIDPDSDIDILISQRLSTVQTEGEAFLRDGYILMCLHHAYVINGEYKSTDVDFARFLMDNELGIGLQSANQRRIVYSKFCEFDKEVIDMIKAMGLQKAFVCAKVKSLDDSNVLRICQTALTAPTVGDVTIRLKDEFSSNNNSGNQAVIEARLIGKEVMREQKRKIERQANTITCLAENEIGDLIGGQIFVLRNHPITCGFGSVNTKYIEERIKAICNASRNDHNQDEFFYALVLQLWDKLSPDEQNRINAALFAKFPRERVRKPFTIVA